MQSVRYTHITRIYDGAMCTHSHLYRFHFWAIIPLLYHPFRAPNKFSTRLLDALRSTWKPFRLRHHQKCNHILLAIDAARAHGQWTRASIELMKKKWLKYFLIKFTFFHLFLFFIYCALNAYPLWRIMCMCRSFFFLSRAPHYTDCRLHVFGSWNSSLVPLADILK